jgi:hypothetical protein
VFYFIGLITPRDTNDNLMKKQHDAALLLVLGQAHGHSMGVHPSPSHLGTLLVPPLLIFCHLDCASCWMVCPSPPTSELYLGTAPHKQTLLDRFCPVSCCLQMRHCTGVHIQVLGRWGPHNRQVQEGIHQLCQVQEGVHQCSRRPEKMHDKAATTESCACLILNFACTACPVIT